MERIKEQGFIQRISSGIKQHEVAATFAMFTTVAAALGGCARSESPASGNGIPSMSRGAELFTDYIKGIENKINFNHQARELDPQAKDLIISLVNQQDTFLLPSLSRQSNILDKAGLEKSKKEIYDKIKKSIPNLPEYSEENYNYAVTEEIPNMMANFGVVAKVRPLLGTAKEWEIAELGFSFLKIEKIEKVVGNDGKEVNILHLVPLQIDGKTIEGIEAEGLSGQARYGNILIFDASLQEEVQSVYDFKDQVLPLIKEIPDLSYENLVNSALRVTPKDRASAVLYFALVKLVLNNPNIEQSVKERTIQHELGHLRLSDASFFDYFLTQVSKAQSVGDVLNEQVEFNAHDELNGFLGELLGTSNKEESLVYFVNSLQAFFANEPINYDEAGYAYAAKWLYENIISEIKKDPQKLGIKLEEEIGISEGEQLLLQLPDVVVNNEAAFNELIVNLTNLAKNSLDQAIVDKQYFPSSTSKDNGNNFDPIPPLVVGFGLLTFLVLYNSIRDRVKSKK